MINSLEKFGEAFQLEIKHVNDTITVKPIENSIIDFSEEDTEAIYSTLDKLYTELFEKNKKSFPYLLTGEKTDDLLLMPLEEYLCCCEEHRDNDGIDISLYFDCDSKQIPLLSYREIFKNVFRLYIRKYLSNKVEG
ncbi:hypothetical protein FHH43_01580 [Clostridium perfringens]|nr:hypothetical protein [Clostridium perfringens]